MAFLKDSIKGTGAAFDKLKSPEETLAWVRERFNQVGVPILQETTRIDKGRLEIPVFISRYTAEASRVTGNPKQMGKGASIPQAEASAVMELVERFSLFSFLKERPRAVCRMGELEGEVMPLADLIQALHLDDMDPEQARALVESVPMEWVRAHRPSDGRDVWLPWSWFWVINEYNGSAAGNSLEEAAVQALSEVVERHVCSVISYGQLETPTIRPESVRDPVARHLMDRFEACGIRFVLKDFSLGMGIPTVGAIAWDPSTYPKRSEIVYTAGTAPHPERALIRALTEVAQLAGDFDTEGVYVESGLPKFETLEEAGYILESPSVVDIDEMPRCESENFRQEVQKLCAALGEGGFHGYLVDITHPELGVPAVYAVIPGNHFRDRTVGLDLVFHCARLVAAHHDPSEALASLQAMHEVCPDRFDVAFYVGHALERMEAYDEALKWYERALELDPDPQEVASIHCHIGACRKDLEDFDGAIQALEQARSLNAELKEIHNLLGYCYYRQGMHVEAIEAFEQAISIDPSSAVDYANIGSNLRKLGMNQAAVKWYEMALELDPDLDWARSQMEEIRSA